MAQLHLGLFKMDGLQRHLNINVANSMSLHSIPEHFLVLAAAIGASASSLAAAISTQDLIHTSIIDDQTLRLVCISGSLAGAVVSVLAFPTVSKLSNSYDLRKMAGKFLVSTIVGVLATPILFRWFHIPYDVDFVLGTSAAVSLVSWMVLQGVVPRIEKLIISKVPKVEEEESPCTTLAVVEKKSILRDHTD